MSELMCLELSVLLWVAHVLTQSVTARAEFGLAYSFSPRDAQPTPNGLVWGRATRALHNYVENLGPFVAMALALIAGFGFGPAYLGAFRTVSQLAAPHERAALISAIYIVSYLAFSIPAVIAGVVITHEGLRGTSLVYGVVVAAVAATTLLYETRAMRAHRRAAATPAGSA